MRGRVHSAPAVVLLSRTPGAIGPRRVADPAGGRRGSPGRLPQCPGDELAGADAGCFERQPGQGAADAGVGGWTGVGVFVHVPRFERRSPGF